MGLTQQPNQRNFLVSGSETIVLTADVITDSIISTGISSVFYIQSVNVLSLSDETVTYSLEVSMDNITFYPYEDMLDDLALKGFYKGDLTGVNVYLRLRIKVNTNTTGSTELLIGGFQ